MSAHLYTLSVLGVNLTLRTTESQEYLKELEAQLSASIRDVQTQLGIHDPLSVAIMAGFFLSDQLTKQEKIDLNTQKSVQEDSVCQMKLDQLIDLIDSVLL